MGLIDGAGAEADGGESGSGKVSGIGEPRGTGEEEIGVNGLEFSKPRMV